MSNSVLAGCRILVAEDETIIAVLIEELLDAEQCITVGPYFHLGEALRAAQTEDIDLALLDVDLCGESVYPVAEELARRNIPFLLFSGYGEHTVPSELPTGVVTVNR
jgi:CheY-like chemotaxis protein